MNSFSLYFGPKFITIAESRGKKIVNSLEIPLDEAINSGIEDKVPEEVKIVAFLSNELRKNRFEIKEAAVVISGRDLIVRTFDLPSSLSQRELAGAINYEARKYIPFKIEDLVTAYQWKLDLKSKKYEVLFMGLKKDIFDKYLYIFKQLNIRVKLIEYSAFSIIRYLKLFGFRFKGVSAVVDIDLGDADEGNFIVLENGYPLFSRDIVLSSATAVEPQSKEAGKGLSLAIERFNAELRMSLDFYQRKFPGKGIEKVYFISPQDCRAQVEAFMKEKGLTAEFIDFKKFGESVSILSLGYFKAFGGSLYKAIRHEAIKIDLLSVRDRAASGIEKGFDSDSISVKGIFSFIRIDFRVVFLGILICAISYGFGLYQILPLQKEIADFSQKLPKYTMVDSNSSYDNLLSASAKYRNKVKVIRGLVQRDLFITEQIDALPRIVPSGIWLTSFSFGQEIGSDERKIIIKGSVYLEDNDKELQLVNKFLAILKQNPNFRKYSDNMRIVSVGRSSVSDKVSFTNFEISCRDYK